MAKEKPNYTHDCDCCVFLGSVNNYLDGQIDLYYHNQPTMGPTLIARQSSVPSDYISGLQLIETDKYIREAAKRAILYLQGELNGKLPTSG